MAGDNYGMSPSAYPSREDMTHPHWTYTSEKAGSTVGGWAAMNSKGLEASVTSGTAQGWRGMYVNCYPAERDYQTTLAGVSMGLKFTHSGAGWTEMRIRTSYHPARSGRSAGSYEIHYYFKPAAATKSITSQARTAIVTIPAPAGQLHQAVVTPVADLRQAFPDLGNLAADNGLYGIWIGAGAAAGQTARTVVTTLDITRTLDGPAALALQAGLMSDLSRLYPTMGLGSGMEASYSTHLNWSSPTASALTFQHLQPGDSISTYLPRVVRNCHAAGGVASYNHPFGAKMGTPLTGAARAALLSKTAKALFGNRLYGCDILEVGYATRGQMDLSGHVDLWDILLTGGLRLIANGVSDDHAGTVASWSNRQNNYLSDVISASHDPAAVTPMLGQGRTFVSLRTGYSGLLDLSCGATLMGGTRSGSETHATVTVTADALPTNGNLRVVQYRVHGDPTRLTPPAPLTERSYAPSALSNGQVSLTVPNSRSYVRAEIRNSAGVVVAFSNPLWLAPSA